jgi:capsular polysaccharide transport system permease protein
MEKSPVTPVYLEPASSERVSSFLECLRVQVRVITALMKREMLTRYGRHNIGFLWVFGEPMLFTLGVTALWNIIPHHPEGGISVTAFILTGYSTILLWRNMPNRVIGALAPNSSLMFHAQVKLIDVYLSRLILEAAGATGSLFFLTFVFVGLGLVEPPKDYLLALLGWFLLGWYAFSVSLLFGALSERTEFIERLWHIVQYLMIPLSGSFFIVDALPPTLGSMVLLNPTVHCTEMFRAGFFGAGYSWQYSVSYATSASVALTLLGVSQVRLVSSRQALDT